MEWNFYDLQSDDRRAVPTLQAIRTICTKYDVNEPDTMVAAQCIFENGISIISKVFELTDQLVDSNKTSKAHAKKYQTQVVWLTEIPAQLSLGPRKKIETWAHTNSALYCWPRLRKKGHDEIRDMSGEHGEQISIKKARSDGLKAIVTDFTSEIINVEELLRISRSKKSMASPEESTLGA